MKVLYGKIRCVYPDYRLIEIMYKNRIYFLHLSRNQQKKFEPYLAIDSFIHVQIFDDTVRIENVQAYKIINFLKIYRMVGTKIKSYYDIKEIKDGVRKIINKDSYKLFIDLEFTMPPFNYDSKNTKEKFVAEICEYGMYILDSSNNVIDSSYGLVRPVSKLGINERTAEFIHTTKDKILTAPYYSTFYNTLRDYLSFYQPIIYIWGKNDYLVMSNSYAMHKLKPITERKNFINLMQLIKNYYSIKDDIGLYAAYDLFGSKPYISIQDHNALHDAWATVEVFKLFEKEINQ